MKTRSPVDRIEFMRNVLAFLLVGAFIGAMGVFTFFVIPKENEQLLTYMVGQISGMATTALGFYFVSKVGQDALDATRTANTGKALDAIKAAQESSPPDEETAATKAAKQTADAAVDEAEGIADQGVKP